MSVVFTFGGDWIGDGYYTYVPRCVKCKQSSAEYRDTKLCHPCSFYTPEYYEMKYKPVPSKCKTCALEFSSRNALFRHLKETSHEQ